MPPRRIQSESEGEEEIEEVDDVEDSDFEELDEIEDDVKPRRRAAAKKPMSTRSTRASSARSGRASSAAGPSTAPVKARKRQVAVEIPYMPFSNLKLQLRSWSQGAYDRDSESDSRCSGWEDGWKESAPAKSLTGKGKQRPTRSSARTSTRSTPHGFGGYGDDDEEFSTGPSETDYDSDDSLLTRRVRPRVFEPRQTRAQVSFLDPHHT